MTIYLGNLTINQMEQRLGITLTDDERKFFLSTHKDNCNSLGSDEWHCYDIPFMFAAGSVAFLKRCIKILSPYGSQCKCAMQMGVDSNIGKTN